MAEVLLFHHVMGQTPGFFAFADELRQAGHTVHTPNLLDGRTFGSIDEGLAYVGEIGFGKDGEWSTTRQFLTQFQNVEPTSVDQFRGGSKQPILWPPEYKTGEMIYPYENARRK